MNRTIKIRLEDTQELNDTLSEYTQVCQQIVDKCWKVDSNRFRIHHLVYKDMRASSRLSAQLVVSAVAKSCESIKSAIALKGSKPKFKLASVRYDARSYWVKLKEGVCSLTTLTGRKKYHFTLPAYYTKYFDWGVCSAELCRDYKARLWLNVVVSKEDVANEATSSSPVHNIGIDLGINNLAVTSDNRFFKGVSNALDKMQRLRSSLQSKGTKSAKRHLKRVCRRQRLFMRDVNHRVTKLIVESLPAGSIIGLENLKGIREQRKGRKLNRLLGRWSFYQFRQFLTYKAEEKGVKVVLVNPKNTSKCCSVCGQVGTRKVGFFKCGCGYSVNADLNGARNILARINPMGNGSLGLVNAPIVATLVSHC